MSRLAAMQAAGYTERLRSLQATLLELKTTPQPTSNRSGVLTYQVPVSDDWQTVEWTDHLNVVRTTNEVTLEPMPNDYSFSRADIEYTYTPEKQSNPIIYPFLHLEIDGVEWTPFYSPSLGMGFAASAVNSSISAYFESFQQLDLTDYSLANPEYKWLINTNYGTKTSSHRPKLKAKFRLRSTDRGAVSIKIKSYKDF